MRYSVLFLGLLTAACTTQPLVQKEYTVIRETSRPATVETEVKETKTVPAQSAVQQPVVMAQPMVVAPTQPISMVPAVSPVQPVLMQPNFQQMQPVYMPTQNACGSYYGGCGDQVATPAPVMMYYGEPTAYVEQTVLAGVQTTIPAQTQATEPCPHVRPAEPLRSPYNPSVEPVSQSVLTLEPTQSEAPSIIVLQHPAARDLVRCLISDSQCISAYERLGYVQLRHSPQFAGEKEALSVSDYPARKYHDNNNIPRW